MMKISEIFYSIQGESTLIGKPVIFIRTTGCNVRCVYCDTEYAFEKGKEMEMQEIHVHIKPFPCMNVCITGGEPLVQSEDLVKLIKMLKYWGYYVSIETNGTMNITDLKDTDKVVMDIKCPSSGIVIDDIVTKVNVRTLRSCDEIKFVISNVEDQKFVEKWLKTIFKDIIVTISPVILGTDKNLLPIDIGIALKELSEWVKGLNSGHDIRLLPQLHKIMWPDKVKGV